MSTELRYYAYAATKNDGGDTLIKFDYDGTKVWAVTLPNDARSVAVDYLGYVYVATNGGNILKYDPNGNEQWSISISSNKVATSIAVDYPDRNVYYGTSGGDVGSYTNDGNTLRWENINATNSTINEIDIQSVGFNDASVQFVYTVDAASELIKLDAVTGAVEWTYVASNKLNSLAVESNGDVFVGGDHSKLEKINSDGTQAWEVLFNNHVKVVSTNRTTSGDYAYIGNEDKFIAKLNSSDGSEVWRTDEPNNKIVSALAVTGEGRQWAPYGDGEIWVAGQAWVSKLNETGNLTDFASFQEGDTINYFDTDPVPRVLIDESEGANTSETFVSNVLVDLLGTDTQANSEFVSFIAPHMVIDEGATASEQFSKFANTTVGFLEDAAGCEACDPIAVVEAPTTVNSTGSAANDTYPPPDLTVDWIEDAQGANTIAQLANGIVSTTAAGVKADSNLVSDVSGNVALTEGVESADILEFTNLQLVVSLTQTANAADTSSNTGSSTTNVSSSASGGALLANISDVAVVIPTDNANATSTINGLGGSLAALNSATQVSSSVGEQVSGFVALTQSIESGDLYSETQSVLATINEQSTVSSDKETSTTARTTILTSSAQAASTQTSTSQAVLNLTSGVNVDSNTIGLGQHPFDWFETAEQIDTILGLGQGIVAPRNFAVVADSATTESSTTPIIFEGNVATGDLQITGPVQHMGTIDSTVAADTAEDNDAQAPVSIVQDIAANETQGANGALDNTIGVHGITADATIGDFPQAVVLATENVEASHSLTKVSAAISAWLEGVEANEIFGPALQDVFVFWTQQVGAPDEGLVPQAQTSTIIPEQQARGDSSTATVNVTSSGGITEQATHDLAATSTGDSPLLVIEDASSQITSAVTNQVPTNVEQTAKATDKYTPTAQIVSGFVESIAAGDDAPNDDANSIENMQFASTGNELIDALGQASSAIVKGAAAQESWVVQVQTALDIISGAEADDAVIQWEIDFIDDLFTEQTDASDQFANAIETVAELQGHVNLTSAFVTVLTSLVEIGEPAKATSMVEAINLSTFAPIHNQGVKLKDFFDAVADLKGQFQNFVAQIGSGDFETAQVTATTTIKEQVNVTSTFERTLTKLTGVGRVVVAAITITGTLSGVNTLT